MPTRPMDHGFLKEYADYQKKWLKPQNKFCVTVIGAQTGI